MTTLNFCSSVLVLHSSSPCIFFCVYTVSCSKHSLFICLSMVLVLVCSFTWRTVPWESGRVWIILIDGNYPCISWGKPSTTSTTSSCLKFLCSVDHFWRSWGKYSPVHLVQNKSARYCTCLQCPQVYWSSLLKVSGRMLGCTFISNKWLGVKGSVLGVWRLLLMRVCSFTGALRILRAVRICLSQTPAWW